MEKGVEHVLHRQPVGSSCDVEALCLMHWFHPESAKEGTWAGVSGCHWDTRVLGLGSRVQGLDSGGSGVWGLGFRVEGGEPLISKDQTSPFPDQPHIASLSTLTAKAPS
eukprot:117771-Rhodomonas_salina.1